jgi:hypothetical protein
VCAREMGQLTGGPQVSAPYCPSGLLRAHGGKWAEFLGFWPSDRVLLFLFFSDFLFLSFLYFFDFRFKPKFSTKLKYPNLDTIMDKILFTKFILCYIIFISHFIYIVLNSLHCTFGSDSNFPLMVIFLFLLFYYLVHKQVKLHHNAQLNKTQHDAHINLCVIGYLIPFLRVFIHM